MQRIVALIIGALILIFLFLTWQKKSAQGYESATYMGFTIWGGIVSAVGVVGVVVTCLMGDRLQPFNKQSKIIAMVCFGLIFLLSLIVALASSGTEQGQTNFGEIVEIKKSAGIGAWLTLVAAVAGIAWVSGILNQLTAGKTTSPATFNPPTPPMPGATPPTPPGSMPPPPPPPSN